MTRRVEAQALMLTADLEAIATGGAVDTTAASVQSDVEAIATDVTPED